MSDAGGWRTASGVLVVSLLAIVAFAMFTIPRTRVDKYETKFFEFKRALDELREQVALRRTEVDSQVARELAAIDEMKVELTHLAKELSEAMDVVEDFDRRLLDLEKASVELQILRQHGEYGRGALSAYDEVWGRPVELPSHLKVKSRALVGDVATLVVTWDFDTFVRDMWELELLPGEDGGELSPEQKKDLTDALSTFVTNVMVAETQEKLLKDSLVEELVRRGEYIEVSTDETAGALRDLMDRSPPGAPVVRKQGAANRIFLLPYAEYPELARFSKRRENIKDHLIVAVHDVGVARDRTEE